MAYDLIILSAKASAEMAEKLAHGMKAYRLPGGVIPQNRIDYRNILMDTEEMPLDDEGRHVLADAGYLIVLFNPEARRSEAVNERLRFYEKQCGRETIVPVIADGEPVDIFPEMFIQHRIVQKIEPDGSIVTRNELIEPVAADLRGDTEKRRKQLLEYETVRIIASVLGLHPDDLERRAAQRKKRRVLMAAGIVGGLLLAAAILFGILGVRAKREGDIAAAQADQAAKAVSRLTEELPETFPEPEAEEILTDAVENARQELDEAGLGSYMTEEEE